MYSLFPTDSAERRVQFGVIAHPLVDTLCVITISQRAGGYTWCNNHFPAVDGILSSQLAVGILPYRLC